MMHSNIPSHPVIYNIPISADNFSSNEAKHSNDPFQADVMLRAKNPNQLDDTQRRWKRLSDSVALHPSVNGFANLQAQNNFSLLRNPSNVTLHRRSFRLMQVSSNLSTIPQGSTPNMVDEGQKLFIVRHGERVDSTFGANWIDHVFDKATGSYHRINLNLPKKMVKRKDYKDFQFDPPLTELGLHQCKMVGEELAAQGVQIDHVYCSPALRCIQTADQILQGLNRRDLIPIRIEPCLFEFLKWYSVLPVQWPFMNADELIANGFHIDRSYQAQYPIESLRRDEDELMFYHRSHLITTSILKNHQKDGKNILIVGHVSHRSPSINTID